MFQELDFWNVLIEFDLDLGRGWDIFGITYPQY